MHRNLDRIVSWICEIAFDSFRRVDESWEYFDKVFGAQQQQRNGGIWGQLYFNFHSFKTCLCIFAFAWIGNKNITVRFNFIFLKGAEVSREGEKKKDWCWDQKSLWARWTQFLTHSCFFLHQCIFSSELTLLVGNPFFSRTVKVPMEFWSAAVCRLSKLVPFLASLRWCLVLSQSPDCSRRKLFSSSSIITLSWNLWRERDQTLALKDGRHPVNFRLFS